MSTLGHYGAFSFGLVIGWFLFFLNRYRRGEASFSDLATILGAVGGAAVTSLFGGGSEPLFGAYGIGLAVGFFSYFLILAAMVAGSDNFDIDYFLDGRRKTLPASHYIPGETQQPSYPFDAPTDQSAAVVHAAVTAAVDATKGRST